MLLRPIVRLSQIFQGFSRILEHIALLRYRYLLYNNTIAMLQGRKY